MNLLNILLVSYHSSLNNGDRALLEINIEQLKRAFAKPDFTVAAAWPDEPYFVSATQFRVIPSVWRLVGIRQLAAPWSQIYGSLRGALLARLFLMGATGSIPADWLQLFQAYQAADVIASVSSTHFYSTGRYGWPFPVKIFQVELAHWFQKPLYILPQSIGPLRWGWEKKALSAAYRKARIVFLRDQFSLRLANEIQIPPERVRFAPDPTFAFLPDTRAAALAVLAGYGFDSSRPSVGMSIIPWQGKWISEELMIRYYRDLAQTLTIFHQETGAQVFLFNQVTGPTPLDDDRVAAKKLLEQFLPSDTWFQHVDEILPPQTFKACYGCMDLFLATRMHSGIFSMGMNTPVIFIGYMEKTRGLMEALGLEDWVVDLKQLSAEVLLEKMRLAWQERQTRRELLARRIQPIRSQVYEVSELIRADYARLKS